MAHKYVLDTHALVWYLEGNPQAVLADPRLEIYPLNWEVFQQTLTATAVPEMHDRQIVATAIHLRALGHTTSVLTKDNTIVAAGLVPITW